LIVADGKGYEENENVEIYDVGLFKGRLNRIFRATKHALNKALELNSDVYHLHDPELLPIVRGLKKAGKQVIFDAHEDVPKQLKKKSYLNPLTRTLLSRVFGAYEKVVFKIVDFVVAATPAIETKFRRLGNVCYCVNNYPIIGELTKDLNSWAAKKNRIAYVGAIGNMRGIQQVVRAMEIQRSNVNLQLAGKFASFMEEEEARSKLGWENVTMYGYVGREQVKEILSQSVAGLVTFLPAPNHVDAQPNKMFEYMSAGIPVIGSNFDLWKEVIEENNCGICVDPNSPEAIATAIDYLVVHPEVAEKMGRNGKKAVYEKYNWDIEKQKLFELYRSLR
jgi:glycosyltransferase involved in cell wall biosynthesis